MTVLSTFADSNMPLKARTALVVTKGSLLQYFCKDFH